MLVFDVKETSMDWLKSKRHAAACVVVSIALAVTIGVPYSAIAEESIFLSDTSSREAAIVSETGFSGDASSDADGSSAAESEQSESDASGDAIDSPNGSGHDGSPANDAIGEGFEQSGGSPIDGDKVASELAEDAAEADANAGDAAEETYEVDTQDDLQNLINRIADETVQNKPIKIKGSIDLTGPITVPAYSADYLAIVADDSVVVTAAPGARHIRVEPQSDNRALYFKNIVLDGKGNGGGIEFEQGTSSFYLNAVPEGTLPPELGDPLLTLRNCAATEGAALHSINTALHVYDTVFTKNAATERGGAVFLGTEAWMHLEGSSASANSAADGGAVYAAGVGQPEIEMTDSSFEANRASKSGGAVYSERYLTITSSIFQDNTAGGNGGAIALVSTDGNYEVSLFLAHVRMFGNEATGANGQGHGGAIYGYAFNPYLFIEDSDSSDNETDIHNNTAQNSGGGLYFEGSETSSTTSVAMTTGSIHDNVAVGGQGGGMAFKGGSVSISLGPVYNPDPPVFKPHIYANRAQGNGGGIYASASENVTLESRYGIIENNASGAEGGGIAFDQTPSAIIQLNGTSVDGNTAAGNGGGIAVSAEMCFIYPSAAVDATGAFVTNTSISNNSSNGNGGGVYAKNPDVGDYHMLTIQMQSVLLDGNYAQGDGGGMYGVATSSATVYAAVGVEESTMSISRNTAGGSGGGVYVASEQSASFNGNGASLEGNTAGSEASRGDGGAVYLAAEKGNASYGFNESNTYQKNALIGNHAHGNGGGIYVVSHQQAYSHIEGVNIEDNRAEEHGGGIYTKSPVISLTLNGGWDPDTWERSTRYVSENSAGTGSGGAIYFEGSHIESRFEAMEFRGNSAQEDGGAVYAFENAAEVDTDIALDVILSETMFSENEAGGSGGAMYGAGSSESENAWSSFTATSAQFEANVARSGSGGAVHLDESLKKLSLLIDSQGSKPAEFVGNTAATDGGALYLGQGWHGGTIEDALFEGNAAGSNGGALALGAIADHENADETSIVSSRFEGNRAGFSGGGVWTPYENLGNLSVDAEGQTEGSTTFSGNTASRELESVLLKNPGDIALHDQKVHTRSFSERPGSYDASALAGRSTDPFEYGYNNYDISYRNAAMVLYDGNGATGGQAPVDNRKYLPGESAEVKADHTLVREGYEFAGWSLEPDGGEPVASPVAMGDADVVLYAMWAKVPGPEEAGDPGGPGDSGEPADSGGSGAANGSSNPDGAARGLPRAGDAVALGIVALAALGGLAAALASLVAWGRRRRSGI